MIVEQQFFDHLATTAKPVQLVCNVDDLSAAAARRLVYPAYAQVKYDGVWCGVVRFGDEIIYFSRTGKRFYLDAATLNHTPGMFEEQVVYIGELVNSMLSLEELSGAVNPNRVALWDQATNEAMTSASVCYFHDYVPLGDFVQGVCTQSYAQRGEALCESLIGTGLKVIQNVPMDNLEQFEIWSQFRINDGHEGAVLKQIGASWVAGHKSFHTIKRVRQLHLDLKCIGVEYGKGKFAGLIAKLKFEYGGKPFFAGLGKGWTLERMQRETNAHVHGGVVGAIWHVSALQVSSQWVLRLPKTNERRIDKEQPDEKAW